MMATAGPPSSSSLLPLLESLEDSSAGQSEHTDAYLTIANRLSGEEARQFLPAVEKHFSRLGKTILNHITSPNAELSQAALQALGFCVYHSQVVSGVPEDFAAEILSALCSLVVKSTDKNTCTRALWVLSKQSFPPDVVSKKVPSILGTLESVWSRDDIQSVVMEHEALNVIIRLLEQVPAPMGDGAVRWAKLVIPLVVHSASKVRLRAAAAMEMGMPLLLEKQTEVAAIIEPMMSTKLIPELQKLFMSKNETNVLKLWPLFVKLLGKMLHRGGPFINSLLHLEELGFRSSSPTIKKIAFIAWKSLIDNFSLNPDILCSAKRIKLLMQPLASIHVRTEALLLTKVEVWWYLVVQLGPNLAPNFDQVSVPLLQCTIGCDGSSVPATPSRSVTQNGAATPGTPKTTATPGFNSPANTPRMSLNSTVQVPSSFPSIQLLGLEMLLHYFLGPETVATAAKRKLTLSLEPLNHALVSGSSSFTKHAAVLISTLRDGFISVGKDAPDALLNVLWTNLVRFVNMTIESGGSKKDRQGSEVLTLMLQALQSIVTSENLPAHKVLVLLEATVKGVPQRVLGSASYQVGKMDVLNGTPALYLILLLYNSSMLSAYIEDERFFQCLQTLVGCGLSGHTSPLAFAEAVLGAIGGSARSLQSKEQLWRMWSVMVGPLTDTITQSNEVNQGDALEHNFSAMHSALLFPVTHLLRGSPLQQASQKSMLSTWSKLYKVFARCSSLVVTAEENVCCEELCAKMTASIDRDALTVPSTLNAVSSLLQVMVECVDFSPYSPQFQQKLKSPHTPVNWMRKRSKALGNLSTFQSLLVQCLEVYLQAPDASSEATGVSLVSIMSALFTNLVLANVVQEALASLVQPLSLLYKHAASEPPEFTSLLLTKLEKLLGDVLGCVQSRSSLAFNDELLALLSPLLCVLFPLKNKQLRTSVTQFWNATFANSVSLTYPEEIRPILSQVKQKIPIILPGFEVVTVSGDLSGQYSSESSQLETKLSGIPVSSVGKRDSLLGKDKSSTKTSKPVSTKLDFGSPKPPRREVLEEEASIDFVFIPPETKERVLTEHQKEVKRTKRADIPAMYNNLDASLDTTVFTQYTQSQEDSSEKLQTEQTDKVTKEAPDKVPQEDDAEIPARESGDCSSPKETEKETEKHEEMIPEPADVSMEEDAKSDTAEDMDMQSKEGSSPNISSSSDLVSGTPQKPNSRRQSFITLEKYAEGKPASPSSTFTGRLGKSSSSQERSKTSKASPSQASQSPDSLDSQTPGKMDSQNPVNDATESPRRPKDSGIKSEPVRLTERLPSDTTEDEDVIPDTQTDAEDMQPSSQEEELNDSQASMSQASQGETRRSGRRKVKPVLSGEDPEAQGEKSLTKRRRSGEKPNNDSPDSTQSRVTRRSQQLSEEASSKERLRTRAQRDKSETSQTDSQGRAQKKIKLQSNSDESLDNPEPRRGRPRSTREQESSQTVLQSDSESQTQKKRGRPKKVSSEINKEVAVKTKMRDSHEKEQSSQTDTQVVEQKEKDDDEVMNDSQLTTPSPHTGARSQDSEVGEQTEQADHELMNDSQIISSSPQTGTRSQDSEVVEQKEDHELKSDSQMITPSPQTDTRSQEFELVEQTKQDDHELKSDSQMISSSPQTGTRSQEFELVEQTEKDAVKPKDSQILTSSQPDGQSLESELVEETKKEECSISVSTNEAQDGTDTTNELENESEVKGKPKTSDGVDDDLSQEDSEVITPVSSESQSRRRSGRSKAPAESEDKSDSQPSSGRGRRSTSKTSAVGQAEASIGGRTRRSKSTPGSTPESSQSLEVPGSSESSQGRGRYSKRKSSQALVPSLESSESESSQAKEISVMPKKRGRKPKVSLPSPLAADCKIDGIDNDVAKDVVDDSQEEDTQITEVTAETVLDESQKSPNVPDSESFQDEAEPEEQPNRESPMEEEADAVVASEPVVPEKTEIDDKEGSEVSPGKKEQRDSPTKTDETSSQENDTEDVEVPEPVGSSNEQIEETVPPAVETLVSLDETTEEPQVSESPEEPQVSESPEEPQVSESPEDQAEDVSETGDSDKENENADSDQEHPVVPVEAAPQDENQVEILNVTDEPSKEEEPSEQPTELSSEEDAAPPPENDEDDNQMMDEEETQADDAENDVFVNLNAAPTDLCDAPADCSGKDDFQDSPVRHKELEAVMGLDVGQSPSGGKTRGTWSPSASPSTSILKKGQKRPLEDETPSPLVKSRRVSFANPIQRQEMADDIDRRSPAIRTSSPRRSKVSGIPLPKYVTTPTKGLLILSPRNLRSPGSKSSKKCLISEMNQEPRPVPRDCIYPALVGCSAPVEAVLPQISSTLWSRGFGQLVRARNIKTVGDLSALTPHEIKTLPIRSPKISNVKKALKFYEQQRKGRGGDELKSLDELELMTSQLEETSAPQNQEDEDKTSGETLAMELVDEPVPADERSLQDVSEDQTPDTPTGGEDEGPLHDDGLLSDVDALTCRMTPLELSRCSPLQLVHMHDQLGGLMSRVVGELQTRLCQTDGKT
ncbi:telomere-associated protein RIF1 isoform X1 [Hippoglossus stenolepis]|uniref:telomere-associated protein RIF1 isoform X1 n=1 Tax=Hippoglossus stenolepis TaxID=195615 RepID=UPI001FAF61A8|nr:telomere-associated protein RIF1 isoform X1 [Hippoglossus stenolepis]XP_047198585.1 telomere-associated protein RIF1 isoform X1 [Hippoglossus stenolepis]